MGWRRDWPAMDAGVVKIERPFYVGLSEEK